MGGLDRERHLAGRYWPTWSTGALIASRPSCLSSTVGRHSGGVSRTCSVSTRWCTAVTVTRREMSLTCSLSATGLRAGQGSRRVGAHRRNLAEQRLERLAASWSGPGRRSRLAARGDGRDADADAARDRRSLAKTLCSTNPCESMIEIVRHTQRNVKRWRDGDMRKRWTAAAYSSPSSSSADRRLPRPRETRDRDRAPAPGGRPRPATPLTLRCRIVCAEPSGGRTEQTRGTPPRLRERRRLYCPRPPRDRGARDAEFQREPVRVDERD